MLGAAPLAVPVGSTPLFAHQGGWDEVLLVVAPLALIGGLLWLANRRVSAQLDRELDNEKGGPDSVHEPDTTTGEVVDPAAGTQRRSPGDDGQG